MIDDFQLFVNGDDGAPIDPDVALLTAYLARELTPVQVAAVERRLTNDEAFRATVTPLIAAWETPVGIGADMSSEFTGHGPLVTREELDRGWQRYTVSTGASRPPVRERRAPSWGRIAALIAFVVLPLLAVAQGVRYLVRRAPTSAVAAADIAFSPSAAHAVIGADMAVAPGRGLAMVPRSDSERTTAPSAQAGQWAVDATPLVAIGAAGGAYTRVSGWSQSQSAAPDVFDGIKGVVRLTDGRIVVGQFYGGLRFFDSTGKYLSTADRYTLGIAPKGVWDVMQYRGDSLLVVTNVSSGSATSRSGTTNSLTVTDHSDFSGAVVDANGRRGRVVSARGEWVHPPVASDMSTSGFQGVFATGGFVIRGETNIISGAPAGMRRERWEYAWTPSAGYPSTVLAVPTLDASEVQFSPQMTPHAAVHGQSFYWIEGNRFEVTVFDLAPGGAPTMRTLRSARTPAMLTDSMRARYSRRGMAADSARSTGALFDSKLTWLDRLTRGTVPAVANMLVDEGGNVWLEHFRVTMPFPGWEPDDTDAPVWTVLDPSGKDLGDVATPRGLAVVSIGSDWVLGTVHDAQGVDHVQLHRIRK